MYRFTYGTGVVDVGMIDGVKVNDQLLPGRSVEAVVFQLMMSGNFGELSGKGQWRAADTLGGGLAVTMTRGPRALAYMNRKTACGTLG